MNTDEKITERELKRNGSGYLDLTAYKAIKKADAKKRKKKGPNKNRKKCGPKSYGASDMNKNRSLKQYKKWKLKILGQLGIKLTEEDEKYIMSCTSERAIDKYAHDLIMKED